MNSDRKEELDAQFCRAPELDAQFCRAPELGEIR